MPHDGGRDGVGGAVATLRERLRLSAVRMIDLFREWDEDGSGTVSRSEFHRAIPLVVDVDSLWQSSDELVDALFDVFDEENDNELDYRHVAKALRRHAPTRTDAASRADAAPDGHADVSAAPSRPRHLAPLAVPARNRLALRTSSSHPVLREERRAGATDAPRGGTLPPLGKKAATKPAFVRALVERAAPLYASGGSANKQPNADEPLHKKSAASWRAIKPRPSAAPDPRLNPMSRFFWASKKPR